MKVVNNRLELPQVNGGWQLSEARSISFALPGRGLPMEIQSAILPPVT